MTETDDPAKLRAYAEQQRQLARDLLDGRVDPPFYIEREEHGGRKVRHHAHRKDLTKAEAKRQVREAADNARQAHADAIREAEELERTRI